MIIPVAPRDVDESVGAKVALTRIRLCCWLRGGRDRRGPIPVAASCCDVLHGVFDLLADLLVALDMPPTTAAQQPKHN
ncbi:MAG: hypothetical protein JWM45_2268, partial [Pseudonocardiales bacterium]|nr:hypothetical protein [Pseudonocardiales bacterium]